jgi:hypothetical protein
MAGTGFHSVVANRAQMCTAELAYGGIYTADCHKENKRTADCHIPVVANSDTFDSSLRFAKGFFLFWQTAVHLRVVCQGVFLVLPNEGIGERFPTTD